MFTDQFRHELGNYMKGQGDKLLAHQRSVVSATYNTKTGNLMRYLSAGPVVQGNLFGGASVEVAYPIYIRFLDMKKTWSKKKQKLVRKKRYTPVYNKYVYGYLKSDIFKKLNELIPRVMIRAIQNNIREVR